MIDIKVLATGSSGNCYQVSDGKTNLLLDAGIGFNVIRKEVRLSQITGVLVTHEHRDHCRAVPGLITHGVRVWALKDVFRSLNVGNAFTRYAVPMVSIDGNIESWIQIGSFNCVPFSLAHDVPNIGWYLVSRVTGESLLYFTDTRHVRYRFPDVNYMLAECNYDNALLVARAASGDLDRSLAERIVHSHMGLDQLRSFLSTNNLNSLKKIVLIHLSNDNSNESNIREEVSKLTSAEVIIA